MHPLSGFRAGVGSQQIDFAFAASRHDHPFAKAELHLARRQVGRANHQSADQVFGLVSALDAGEHRAAVVAAKTQGQFQELLRSRHVFGRHYPGHTQIDRGELLEIDRLGDRLGQ